MELKHSVDEEENKVWVSEWLQSRTLTLFLSSPTLFQSGPDDWAEGQIWLSFR